ncbi:MAG: hypothetical protein ACOYL6_17935 [Bacteriovoracaceae bacterium]
MKSFFYISMIMFSTTCFGSSNISVAALRESAKKQVLNSKLGSYFDSSAVKVYFIEGATLLDTNPSDVSAVYVISQKPLGFENLSTSLRYYNHIGIQFRTDGSSPQIRYVALDENNNIYVATRNFNIVFDPKITCEEIRQFFSSDEIKVCYPFGVAVIEVSPNRMLEISKLSWLEDISADKETYGYPFVFGPGIDVSSETTLDVDQFRTFTNELRKEGNITPSVTDILIP